MLGYLIKYRPCEAQFVVAWIMAESEIIENNKAKQRGSNSSWCLSHYYYSLTAYLGQ